ncbi:NAD(P)-dependent oxidoreductase [Salibaculum griseiflavum]|uniref:NAD(P)-dependent oxidoreductase n=1 Tax=Salibaculum griseiflavum TaxID=1914409 RepID=A0A2V1P663_9RHOB|nr:NAD(P)-dependent oxidoreductase [Salibaculum griseiflavum]PWG17826.1 NAD(P)-dependent oxidoreductase [Salibaculum griseiflavum]
MRVGFAGLGRMGAHMAGNLVGAGFDVTVWNRSSAKARMLAQHTGCGLAETPRALAASCDVVVTMLADDPSSEAVHLGEEGLFAANGAKLFVEMGTMSPDHIAALVQAAPEGTRVIDAPVSGATQAAADAQLLIMAGCTEAEAESLGPLFDAMGRATICLGAAGAGSVMKLAVNSLIHGLNQTLAEAMTLAEAAGIAPEAAFDVIENSAAAAPMLKYRRPLYLDEDAHDVTFTVALARKDMEVTAALADRLGTAMPQGRVTLDKLLQAEAEGYGARDMASILQFMRKDTQ